MSNELEKYEDLKKIEDSNFITSLQKIRSDISNPFSPIPNRIISINLLRSLSKFHMSYFFNFFWGIRFDFLKNCLNYNDSLKLQQISFLFLNEVITYIYNEISHEEINEFIFWIYKYMFAFLTNSNNFLKTGAQNLIKDISKTIPSEAVIISLIKSLTVKDENILNFLFNCIELYFSEFISYGLSFDFIIESLEIENISEDKVYYMQIKNAFSVLNPT